MIQSMYCYHRPEAYRSFTNTVTSASCVTKMLQDLHADKFMVNLDEDDD